MLAPDAQKLLKKYHIDLPKDLFDKTQPRYVKTQDLKTGLTRNYSRNYLNINREKFDRFLLANVIARSNATRQSHQIHPYFSYQVKTITKQDNHFIINNDIRAKILVGADGSTSIVRRTFFPNLKIRKYASIQDIIFPSPLMGDGQGGGDNNYQNHYHCYFNSDISDYYGWSLPKDDHILVGFAIPEGKDVVAKFEHFKQILGFGRGLERQGTLILRPNFFHSVSAENNLFLIGEAGGYISPSSAEGISYAIKTAKILADSNFEVSKFKRKMLRIRLNIFYKNLKSIAMYHPIIRKVIMKVTPCPKK